MAIDLYWDDDVQSVMLVEFEERWTWDDLNRVIKTIRRMSTEQGQVYGAIVDVRKGFRLPDGALLSAENLAQFRQLWAMNEDHEKGPAVIVGMNRGVRLIFDTVGRIEPRATENVQFADTMSEAQSLIYPMMKRFNVTSGNISASSD